MPKSLVSLAVKAEIFKMNKTLYIFILHYFNICHTLRTRGEWYSENEFFHFITKFGFQKTNQHEIELSEGYIFGNITILNRSKAYHHGTLALLPQQYFINYYKNRSLSLFNNADIACQTMFKGISNEAYDAQCHDSGREDFLRKIPCPENELCIDEDNPGNIIPGNQLTFVVQDINNPRFWFLSLVACQRNKTTCLWQHVKASLEVYYDFNIVNGKPFASRNNPFEYHFSFEQQDTVEIYLVCLLFYGCCLVPIQGYATWKQIHPITRLFTGILCTQLIGLCFNSLHLLIFSLNGSGVPALSVLGDLSTNVAQSLFMMLLLLLARGWAITRMVLTRRGLLIVLWLSYTVLIFVLYFWNKIEVDVIEDIDEYQTWPGWLTLVLRVVIMFWFLFELRNTMKCENNSAKLQFFLQFGAASLVWFIYIPIIALIALQISPLWRFKVLLGFSYCADLVSHSFMTYMLWPQRSEQYLLIADEVDLSEEMETFDEAPHIVNHQTHELDFLSPVSDLSSTESLVIVA